MKMKRYEGDPTRRPGPVFASPALFEIAQEEEYYD
jgi:hypothetical protein